MPIACDFLLPQVIFFTAAGDARFCVAGAAFQGLIACGGTLLRLMHSRMQGRFYDGTKRDCAY